MIQYSVIGLQYTLTCPLACAHCITESSPKVKGRMRIAQAVGYLRPISKFSSQVCFTGGEPILYHREIATVIREAKSLSLIVSLVTGAGWVTNQAKARAKIETLVSAGLTGLCISWDQYHEEFSSTERAVGLARIGIDCGLDVTVRTVTSPNRPKDEYQAAFAGLPVRFEANPAVQLGRAASLPASHFGFTSEPPTGVCSVILSPVIEPDGIVYACCGPSHYCRKPSPLILGDATKEPLEAILSRATRNPILEIILQLGPYGLYLLLQAHPIGRKRFKARSAYSGMCELCLDITNDPELVDAVHERLRDADARRIVAASKLWFDRKLMPAMQKQFQESRRVMENA